MKNYYIIYLLTFSVELRITFDYSTGIVATTGMQICGLQTKPFALETRLTSFDSVDFVPLSGTYRVSLKPKT